mmetsp:Transcript_32980/g.79763  ORF Transcript_32980/g.79763 Transcript_32980/m.79763 type:complete len:301 (-) Transcript_32980:48-950(-)
MALEIVVDTQLLQDLLHGQPKDDAGPNKQHPPPTDKPKKWALESPRKELKRKMKRALRSLQNSDGEIEAQRAIASLCYQASFDGDSSQDDKAEQKLCHVLFRLKAVPILLQALEKWKECLPFASQAVILLIKITYFEPKSLPSMLVAEQHHNNHNGIQLLLHIGTCQHDDDLNLSADILMVLENLSHASLRLDLNKNRKSSCFDCCWMQEALATTDCIDFVATKMQDYPDDDILQRNAAGYLENIGYFACSHHKLYQRGIPYLLENTIDNFSHSNARVASQAREALYVIDNLYQQCGPVE